jgi:hypothetical protein
MAEETYYHKNWLVDITVDKWHDSADYEAGLPANDRFESKNNVLLNAGITRMLNLLIGSGATAFNAANSRIGVGDNSTALAESATNTTLGGTLSTGQYYKLSTSAPSVTNQTVTFVAAFGSGVANFAWQEWCIDNGTADGTTSTAPLLNRKVVSMGTKASGSTWTLTVNITIA